MLNNPNVKVKGDRLKQLVQQSAKNLIDSITWKFSIVMASLQIVATSYFVCRKIFIHVFIFFKEKNIQLKSKRDFMQFNLGTLRG